MGYLKYGGVVRFIRFLELPRKRMRLEYTVIENSLHSELKEVEKRT